MILDSLARAASIVTAAGVIVLVRSLRSRYRPWCRLELNRSSQEASLSLRFLGQAGCEVTRVLIDGRNVTNSEPLIDEAAVLADLDMFEFPSWVRVVTTTANFVDLMRVYHWCEKVDLVYIETTASDAAARADEWKCIQDAFISQCQAHDITIFFTDGVSSREYVVAW